MTINPADPAQGGVGRNVDIKLTGCSKVIEGGVVPSDTTVFVQGTYIKSSSEYHVLIGLDTNTADDAPTVHDHLAPHLPEGRQVGGAPLPRRANMLPRSIRGWIRAEVSRG